MNINFNAKLFVFFREAFDLLMNNIFRKICSLFKRSRSLKIIKDKYLGILALPLHQCKECRIG